MHSNPERTNPTNGQAGRVQKRFTNKMNSVNYSKLATNTPPQNQRAALHYARHGWSVFPLRANEKRPATGDGFKSATTNTAQINHWFARSACNVGIATGNGLFVFDLDIKDGKNGRAVLSALEDEHGQLPDTLTAQTQSGGLHYFFAIPPELNLRNSTDLFSDQYGGGLDVRCNGGYVVAAPSKTAQGYYRWIQKYPVAELPENWLQLLQQPERDKAAQQAQKRHLKRAQIERLIPGQISVIDQFNETYDLATILQNHGYTGQGSRYQSPNSSSGLAGVVLIECDDSRTRCFSHHGSDPLSNAQANDTFDVFCTLEHGGNTGEALQAAGNLLFTQNGATVTDHNRAVYRFRACREALANIPADSLNTVSRVARACRDMPDGFTIWQQWAGNKATPQLWQHLKTQPAFKPGYLIHLAQQQKAA